jgi:hypothetical protein
MNALTDQGEFDSINSRRFERKGLHLAATVRKNATLRYPVDLIDLSVTGFRFKACAALMKGTRVWLTMPGMAGLEAVISWDRGGEFGCEFDRPLHPSVFEHIVKNCS